jgi:hypothetical protein
MGVIFEKLTIWTCTEDYGGIPRLSALDYVTEALRSMEAECMVLDCESEDYTLVPEKEAI